MDPASIATLRIYPPLGIAGVGNAVGDNDYVIGPEVIGAPSTLPNGRPARLVADFRTNDGRIKRQAARFRIYAHLKNGTVEEVTADTARIDWRVAIANLKAGWYEFNQAMDLPNGIRRRWGTTSTEIDDFLRQAGGIGFVVDRTNFDARLRAAAANVGVSFVTGRVVAALGDAGAVVARVETGSAELTISAGVAVDASGRPAALARRLGARRMVAERLIAECQGIDPSQQPCREPTWLDVEGFKGNWSYGILVPTDGGRHGRCVARGIEPDLRRANVAMHRLRACRVPRARAGSRSGTPRPHSIRLLRKD